MLFIRTGSRLHFGLLSVGSKRAAPNARLYGGIGVMIEEPDLLISLSDSPKFEAEGTAANRVLAFAKRWLAFSLRAGSPSLGKNTAGQRQSHGDVAEPIALERLENEIESLPVKISVLRLPPEHSGFGSGTQLGLSVATGLQNWFGFDSLSATDLAIATGRGQRSAVGTHGFCLGGMIADCGKIQSEPLSPLACQINVPDAWRILVVNPPADDHVHGTKEVLAFRDLEPIKPSTKRDLELELNQHMVPAATLGNFSAFAASLGRYSELAGSCFASVQGGNFNGPAIEGIVRTARELGYQGVGQSSWGPGTFIWTSNSSSAETLRTQILERHQLSDDRVWITKPRSQGVNIKWASHGQKEITPC